MTVIAPVYFEIIRDVPQTMGENPHLQFLACDEGPLQSVLTRQLPILRSAPNHLHARMGKLRRFRARYGRETFGHELDRIDTDKGYGPDNCRWANITEQNRNRRNNVHVTYGNQTKVLSEWAEVTGIPYSTLHARIVHLGWTAEQALIKPVQQQVELKLTYNGRTMSTADWSRETGIPNRTIRTRIKMYGWSVDAALTTPVPTK